MAIELVVIHSISLPPGEYGGDAIERLFTNRLDPAAHPYFERLRDLRVSAHFLIRALEHHRYNRTAAGISLGLSLRQMRYRMARLNVNVGGDLTGTDRE